jgi:AcrR family transcriptional regulator
MKVRGGAMPEQMEEQTETERRIFEAAKRVFVQKGMDGASMQDIATSAGISRTSLHYYFRSKKKLFSAVSDDLFAHFLPRLEGIMFDDGLFRKKLERFVDVYLDMLMENPYLQNFIMNELNKNPEALIIRFRNEWLMSDRMKEQIRIDLNKFKNAMDVSQFMVNLLSLCVFPFIARPMIEAIYLDRNQDAFKAFIEERKAIIVNTLMSSIEHNPNEDMK